MTKLKRNTTWYATPSYGLSRKDYPRLYSRTKSALMKKLNGLDPQTAILYRVFRESHTCTFDESCREYAVWHNKQEYASGAEFKLVFKQVPFRGSKYIRSGKIERFDRNYYIWSDKIQTLMSHIGRSERDTPEQAFNLVKLFVKVGFKDFDAPEDDAEYIEHSINSGIPWNYWSDRCNTVRMKAIVEYFKRKGYVLPI